MIMQKAFLTGLGRALRLLLLSAKLSLPFPPHTIYPCMSPYRWRQAEAEKSEVGAGV